MPLVNRYYYRSHIAEMKFRLLLKYFAIDLTVSKTAALTCISRRSVNSIFLKIRERIAREAELASPFKSAEVEVDESYFGSRFTKGKLGLVDVGYQKHYRVIHSKDKFVKGDSHINGIESFWSYAKRRLHKFN